MNNPIPRKPRIVHNKVDFSIPKLRCFLHQSLDIPVIEYIPNNSDGLSTVRGDGFCGCICLSYTTPISIYRRNLLCQE